MKFLRRTITIALMVCFFLPMSQCTINHPNGTETTNVHYPYEISIEAANEITRENIASLGTLLALIIVYFLPLLLEFLTPIKRAIITIIATLYAEYFLYYAIFSVEPRFGGVLSMMLWLSLFIIALIAIFEELSQKIKVRTTFIF